MSGHGHGHSHGSGGCNGEGEHTHDDPEMGVEYSLYTKIDKENLNCLNEAVDGSCKTIFKPWDQRLNFETVVQLLEIIKLTWTCLSQKLLSLISLEFGIEDGGE